MILQTANKLGLTGSNYVWLVTQSVIGDSLDSPVEFPVGMLGNVHHLSFIYSSHHRQ